MEIKYFGTKEVGFTFGYNDFSWNIECIVESKILNLVWLNSFSVCFCCKTSLKPPLGNFELGKKGKTSLVTCAATITDPRML